MKYDEKKFNSAVEYYTKKLKGKVENKLMFVTINLEQQDAIFSIAPLSKAVHELEGDLHVIVEDGTNVNLGILKEVWYVYSDYQRKLKTKKVEALKEFIKAVDKRTGKKVFKDIFKKPEIRLSAEKDHFKGTVDLKFQTGWHTKYMWKDLLKTSKRILTEGYALKKNENLSIGFVLIPTKEHMDLPLEDYLDSYSIALSMAVIAKEMEAKVTLSAVTDRFSQLARPVRSADLVMTLKGCELDKEVDEIVFQKYSILSKLLKLDRMQFQTAGFGIHGKGYYGKHFFGDGIGYPTLNKKTRWSSPGQIMLKDPFSPQTALETRDPMMRYAITETLPIKTFIETCNISYKKLRVLGDKIRDILNTCEQVRVIGKPMNEYMTDFTVHLTNKEGKRRYFISSDCDVTTIHDKEHLKRTGIKAGAFANFPSGEAFVTPETITGTAIGDVVINIDQSYIIPENEPIIMEFTDGKYKVIKAPKKIGKIMKRERNDAREKIRDYEKSKSLPKEIVDIYKRNFWGVGEFAINTNPKAKVSRYLIVNEKISRMIHIALGMGYQPDKKTMYHWDIVIDSPKQKLDIYGIDKKRKAHWIIKKGEFVV
ncbi:MAG: hypothetical protein ABIC04_08890 [Nanoarchaeota archaeon]